MTPTPTVLFSGKHLRFLQKSGWEYVDRVNVTGIVGIVAVTDDGKLLLVEQFRIPVGKHVIEIPAGLAGDESGIEEESLLTAARRELEEETGYLSDQLSILGAGTSSAGLTSEIITLVRAEKLRKTGSGGGVAGEAIVVHEVPLADVEKRLTEWVAEGKLVDLKVYAALHFAAGAA